MYIDSQYIHKLETSPLYLSLKATNYVESMKNVFCDYYYNWFIHESDLRGVRNTNEFCYWGVGACCVGSSGDMSGSNLF